MKQSLLVVLAELWQQKGEAGTKSWFLNQICKFNSEFGLGGKKKSGNLLDETKQ